MEVDLKQVALGIILLVVLYILYKIFSQKRPSLASARKLDGSRHCLLYTSDAADE